MTPSPVTSGLKIVFAMVTLSLGWFFAIMIPVDSQVGRNWAVRLDCPAQQKDSKRDYYLDGSGARFGIPVSDKQNPNDIYYVAESYSDLTSELKSAASSNTAAGGKNAAKANDSDHTNKISDKPALAKYEGKGDKSTSQAEIKEGDWQVSNPPSINDPNAEQWPSEVRTETPELPSFTKRPPVPQWNDKVVQNNGKSPATTSGKKDKAVITAPPKEVAKKEVASQEVAKKEVTPQEVDREARKPNDEQVESAPLASVVKIPEKKKVPDSGKTKVKEPKAASVASTVKASPSGKSEAKVRTETTAVKSEGTKAKAPEKEKTVASIFPLAIPGPVSASSSSPAAARPQIVIPSEQKQTPSASVVKSTEMGQLTVNEKTTLSVPASDVPASSIPSRGVPARDVAAVAPVSSVPSTGKPSEMGQLTVNEKTTLPVSAVTPAAVTPASSVPAARQSSELGRLTVNERGTVPVSVAKPSEMGQLVVNEKGAATGTGHLTVDYSAVMANTPAPGNAYEGASGNYNGVKLIPAGVQQEDEFIKNTTYATNVPKTVNRQQYLPTNQGVVQASASMPVHSSPVRSSSVASPSGTIPATSNNNTSHNNASGISLTPVQMFRTGSDDTPQQLVNYFRLSATKSEEFMRQNAHKLDANGKFPTGTVIVVPE